jgi:hypothetical protein
VSSKKKPVPNPEQPPDKKKREKTPAFLLELPLIVSPAQAKRIRAHLEAARSL